MDFKSFYSRHFKAVWLAVLFVPLFSVGAGVLLLPSLFYDGFLWKYFLGPVAADARNEPVGGITEGYNIVNTTCYAVILVVALLGVYELFRRRVVEFRMDFRMVAALLPYIVLGGTLRASEDLGLFTEPAAYFFIAPFIYATVSAIVLGAVLISIYADYFSLQSYRGGFFFLVRAMVFINACYILIYALFPGALLFYPHPALLAALSAVLIACIYFGTDRRKPIGVAPVFGGLGLLFLSMSAYQLANWGNIPAWSGHYLQLTGTTALPQTHPAELLAITGLALLSTLMVCLAFFAVSRKRAGLAAPLLAPVTVLIVFSQFFDGSATYVGVGFYGYGEKHVLPTSLMSLTGSALVLFPMKLVLVVAVVYIIDILYKKELEKYGNISMLAKTLVIVLGLAPGVRDALRISMGV